MDIVIMVSIIAVIGVVLLAALVYLVDKNADRRDSLRDR
jgi:hypothetical protein